MEQKQFKFLQLFSDLSKLVVLEREALLKRIKPIFNLDFVYGMDVWEYLTTVYEDDLSKNKPLCEFFGTELLEVACAKSENKTIKAITASASIIRFIYQYAPSAASGKSFDILVGYLLARNLSDAEACLKCLYKNESINLSERMREIIERIILELFKKGTAQNKKVEIPNKLSTLLLSYVAKLKAPERALLEQRIRELL